jgi:D-arabinose 1-dehydrogenase-like Zn-dependent alcohol dehydrogenase
MFMKAIVLTAFGGPDVLVEQTLPRPEPGPGDVLVRVDACGICHHDVMHRAGNLPGAKTGVVLGHEAAGEIVAVGSGVAPKAIGTHVVVYQRRFCGACRDCLRGRQDLCRSTSMPSVDTEGGSAEFLAVPLGSTIPLPAGMPFATGALASCPIATSLRALTVVGGLRAGDTVLITGASGGLGAHQIQIAKALGGRVIATTTSPEKEAFLTGLGADAVVVAKDGHFGTEVWKRTGKRGVDIAIDNVGPSLPEALRCVTFGGTCVALGNIAAAPVEIAPGLLIGRRITLAGSGMGTPEDVRRALAMIAAGMVRPVISEIVPFAEVARAHRVLDERGVQGRIVLEGW